MSDPRDHELRLRINGEPRQLAGPLTLAELLEQLRVNPRQVGVERNRSLVPKTEFDRVRLENGDELEIVTFVGGG